MTRVPLNTVLLAASLLLAVAAPPASHAATTETIVMIRHGEKPPKGLGQLSCQGLNRALALGGVLARDFGRPDAIFAPDPSARKQDQGVAYDYVRPLATIEPAAIAFGLPVHASIGVHDLTALATALTDQSLSSSLVVVAWEHAQIVALARLLLGTGGAADRVPAWDTRDYDGIYVVRLTRDAGVVHGVFSRRREGLDGMPENCPAAAPR